MAGKMPSQDDHPMMSEAHKDALTDNWEELSENLVADEMLNKLVAKRIITPGEQQALLAEKVTSRRATDLLHILLKGGDRTYKVLIEALKKYCMPHLAQLLERADI